MKKERMKTTLLDSKKLEKDNSSVKESRKYEEGNNNGKNR